MTREEQLIQHLQNNRPQLAHLFGDQFINDLLKSLKELRLVKRAIIDPTVTDVEAL